ncbi:MAG: heme biosynthesis protein HemY [Proteobacteria bacterium]|nr:heme biosynthesis protein HemY [Pseudomonadota bacterium]
MKTLLKFFLLLLFSIWLGLKISADPGYVLIAYREWSVETPLWFFVIFLILFFVVFHGFWRFCSMTSKVAHDIAAWSKEHRKQKARLLTREGLLKLSMGSWRDAERTLIKSAKESDLPVLNYLAATWAAQQQGGYERCHRYLQVAQRARPDAIRAIELAQAQWQFSSGQLEQALASLKHLHHQIPNHSYVLKLLQEVYLQLQDWESLAHLIPLLNEYDVLNAVEIESLQIKVYRSWIQYLNQKKTIEDVKLHWDEFPKAIKKFERVLESYVEVLIAHDEQELAESILQPFIKHEWDESLIKLYGLVQGKNTNKQLSIAEYWLKHYPKNPVLLLTLGRICVFQQLWGKARHYFEMSLQNLPTAETYLELARLLERLGKKEEAAECYRSGLLLKNA